MKVYLPATPNTDLQFYNITFLLCYVGKEPIFGMFATKVVSIVRY